MLNKVLVVAAFVAFALTLPAGKAPAQAVYGSINGTIFDNTGAVIPGAKVTATNQGQGVSFNATTNASGYYEFTHLIPGTYSVKVEAQGFQTFLQKDIGVQADVANQVNATMTVGAVSQEVTVTGAMPLLKTSKTDVASTFTTRQVEDLPIFNRNFTSFQLLTPGAQRLNGWNHAASENPQGSQQIMVNGQHFAGTAFELDGTDNQDPILGVIIINPNLDAVSETKVTTQNYSAEFGKAVGAVVTAQTKSGSNQWHGSLFDFERSNSDSARNPFTQLTGVPSGNWNQFGGSAGGPIKKDKIFIFGDYQGTRDHGGGSGQDRIPTAAERAGNLGDLGVDIYDPCTDYSSGIGVNDPTCNVPIANRHQFMASSDPASPDYNSLCTLAAGCPNMIPTARLSPQAGYLLQNYLPVGASGTGLNQNYFASGSNVLNADNWDVRGDYYATDKLHTFFRFSQQKYLRAGPGLFGTVAGGPNLPFDPSVGSFAGTSNSNNKEIASGFDYTLSSTWLTDFRFGWFHHFTHVLPGGYGTQPAVDAGIPGLNLDKTYTSGMPYFAIYTPGAQLFSFGYALGANSEIQCNCPLTEDEHQFQYVNNWTNIRGNHTIKFGGDLRFAWNLRVPSDAHRAGQLYFDNATTEGPGGLGGVGMAAFLIGDVSRFSRYVSASTNATETQPRYFFYGTDTWRATRKLTITYGLRWEFYIPESAAGPGLGGWPDLATGEDRIAGENGVNLQGNTSTSMHNFAPRIGIAYEMTPKTVIRLGYGRSYDMGVFGSIFGHAITQNLPVLALQSLNPATTAGSVFSLADGPPSGDPAAALKNNCNSITDPTGTKTQCLGPNGMPLYPDNVGAHIRPFNNRLPYVDAWNATVQRQLTDTMSLSVAYVGNKGTHTFYGDGPGYNINQATVVGYTPGSNQNLRKPFYPLYGWTQGMCFLGNNASNHYNSLQIELEKRYSNGLSLTADYTFQHATFYNSDYTVDPSVSYGPQPDYRNQQLILTEVYDLPFGKGKRWFGNASRVADLVVGGWQLNSIWSIEGGLPFTPSLSTCAPSSDTGPCRPDILGSVGSGTRSGSPTAAGYWFQTTGGVPLSSAGATSGPWGQPALGTFGNVGYNTFRGPGFFNADLSLFKTFSITERVKAQLQFQSFNAFNIANLDLPNGCVDCSNGGSITNIAYGSSMRQWQFGAKIQF